MHLVHIIPLRCNFCSYIILAAYTLRFLAQTEHTRLLITKWANGKSFMQHIRLCIRYEVITSRLDNFIVIILSLLLLVPHYLKPFHPELKSNFEEPPRFYLIHTYIYVWLYVVQYTLLRGVNWMCSAVYIGVCYIISYRYFPHTSWYIEVCCLVANMKVIHKFRYLLKSSALLKTFFFIKNEKVYYHCVFLWR